MRRTSAVRRPTRLASRARSSTPPAKSSSSRRAFGLGGRLPGADERGVRPIQEEAPGGESLPDQGRLHQQELAPARRLAARVDLAGAVRPERGAQGVALGFDGPSQRDGLGDLERLRDRRRSRRGLLVRAPPLATGPIGESVLAYQGAERVQAAPGSAGTRCAGGLRRAGTARRRCSGRAVAVRTRTRRAGRRSMGWGPSGSGRSASRRRRDVWGHGVVRPMGPQARAARAQWPCAPTMAGRGGARGLRPPAMRGCIEWARWPRGAGR